MTYCSEAILSVIWEKKSQNKVRIPIKFLLFCDLYMNLTTLLDTPEEKINNSTLDWLLFCIWTFIY